MFPVVCRAEVLKGICCTKWHFGSYLTKKLIGNISSILLTAYLPLSGDSEITSEKFHPIRFLLEKHCNATFDDLKTGLQHLKEKVRSLSSGPQTFLKRNITNFLAAYETLTSILNLISFYLE